MNAEAVVNGFELDFGELDHLLPDAEVFLVAVLQFDQFLASLFQNSRIFLAGRINCLVKSFHLTNGIGEQVFCIELRLPPHQQLTELCAPVANMIVRDDLVTEEPECAGQGIAEDGGTDVADMHRLGDVGRAEVDDNRARMAGLLEK
ncbi:hypothetical protein Cflav_PD4675 [Pedosphaera parvula Ellin514]|uniref:Uncharacterized protein n=1 Tax=Pedosphaera parvula (strain Ellin514) TaxID=320771 RepID=B9XEC1_PEDPL|nr:hypothetical protein Cflav_PD4675 [Pedosphaera parvula Ellin514]